MAKITEQQQIREVEQHYERTVLPEMEAHYEKQIAELTAEVKRQTARAEMWKEHAEVLWKRIKNAQDSLAD